MKILSKLLLLLGSTALLAACSLTTQPAKNTTPDEPVIQEQNIPDEDEEITINDEDIPADEYQGPLDENGQPTE